MRRMGWLASTAMCVAVLSVHAPQSLNAQVYNVTSQRGGEMRMVEATFQQRVLEMAYTNLDTLLDGDPIPATPVRVAITIDATGAPTPSIVDSVGVPKVLRERIRSVIASWAYLRLYASAGQTIPVDTLRLAIDWNAWCITVDARGMATQVGHVPSAYSLVSTRNLDITSGEVAP